MVSTFLLHFLVPRSLYTAVINPVDSNGFGDLTMHVTTLISFKMIMIAGRKLTTTPWKISR